MSRLRSLGLVAVAVLVAGCATLPPPDGRVETHAVADGAATRLGRAVASDAAANPGRTGVHPLPDPRDAFATRVVLAAAAEKSIDAQYYIWHGDQVGYLLFEAIWLAAERGVRVRLLLDDANTAGLDPTIATLDAHPNIEVRLYNPLVQRSFRAMNFVTDFSRANRRMHNKSFTVDNQLTVVGGRNIGNEYFGVGSGLIFADLDVVATGAAVGDVSREFDVYWNSPSAYPAAQFVGAAAPDGVARLNDRFAATRADPDSVAYAEAVRTTQVVHDIVDRRLTFEWTSARVAYDDPAKTLDREERTDVLLFPKLIAAMGRPEKSLDLISPYFVPGDQGAAALAGLARQGVRVRILTNSLASSDVTAVHAGYSKHRRELLQAGVRLFEFKPTAAAEQRGRAGFGSSGSAGLHAKTFGVDERRIFVGSFNFDQRSALLNTEMGVVLDSPLLAGRLARSFEEIVPQVAYEVVLTPAGSLQWIERGPSGEKRHDVEPGTTWFKRSTVEMLSILPIDWLL
jgi:putative cardiolipin synthase